MNDAGNRDGGMNDFARHRAAEINAQAWPGAAGVRARDVPAPPLAGAADQAVALLGGLHHWADAEGLILDDLIEEASRLFLQELEA